MKTAPVALAMAVLAQPVVAAETDTQRLIDATPGAAAAFAAASDGSAMHRQSGMRCPPSRATLRLVSVTVFPTGPTGDDVACGYAVSDYALTLYATRANGLTSEQAAPGVVASIMSAFPDAKPIQNGPVATLPGIAQANSGSYAATVGGRPVITTVWLAAEAGWLVKVRATYAEAQRREAELIGSVLEALAQMSIVQAASTGGERPRTP